MTIIGIIDWGRHIVNANNDQKASEPKEFAYTRLAIRLFPQKTEIVVNILGSRDHKIRLRLFFINLTLLPIILPIATLLSLTLPVLMF